LIAQLFALLRNIHANEDGASLVEYGLLVALIALVVVAALTATGTSISALFNNIASNLSA
jgi:pilus assembly protein Flp/PilA